MCIEPIAGGMIEDTQLVPSTLSEVLRNLLEALGAFPLKEVIYDDRA